MADFKEAFEKVKSLEFSSKNNALHYNNGEEGYTFMGIYQKVHPDSVIWKVLRDYMKVESHIKKLSVLMYNNYDCQIEVERIYKQGYWDVAKLDNVNSQKIAEEIFIFGVNTGIKRAIKVAQRVVGVIDDGVVGTITIGALNSYSEDKFDIEFDKKELEYYRIIIARNPSLARFERGWENRANEI